MIGVEPSQIIQSLDTKTWFDNTGLNFKLEDVNFDSYQDLRLMVGIPTGPIPYLCWLFDPKTGQFVHSQKLSGLASLEVDADNKQIIS